MARRRRQPLVDRIRNTARDAVHGRFHCAACNRDFRSVRFLNAHHGAVHANRWMSDKARKAARRMGKARDQARRHARGYLTAAGLRDKNGRPTERARSRPQLGGHVTRKQLRNAHRHDRHHQRADRHDRRADAREARGRQSAGRYRDKAKRLRDRWPQPARPAAPPRPGPGVNGHGPSRTPPGGRLAPGPPPAALPRTPPKPGPPSRTPPAGGRLAPTRNGNGGRAAPARTGRPRS